MDTISPRFMNDSLNKADGGSGVREKRDQIPEAWKRLDFNKLHGTLMVVGQPDAGKSTFARFLYGRLSRTLSPVAYLDGDPGQSSLGPPSTLTLAMAGEDGENAFPPQGRIWRRFAGAVSPSGHMLPFLSSLSRLTQAGYKAGARAIVLDTTGLVEPSQGGTELKLAKIDLLRPTVLFAIRREPGLRALLEPLRRSHRVQLVELPVSGAARQKNGLARRSHRSERFARYFARAGDLRLKWPHFAVFPSPHFIPRRLVALEDAEGFTLGLGIVRHYDRNSRQVVLHTPVASAHGVDALRLGDLAVDPEHYTDRTINRY